MKLPRDLSGAELVRHLCRHHGYRQINQEGSHVILQTAEPQPHRLAVPNHAALRIGTLNAILRAVAAAKGIGKEDVLRAL
jgi:predicted RNA binding protein YcfA (HicA-like mRNA interferase family)